MLRNPNISRQILRLAIPSILANITIPLVGIVDTAIAGHIGDAAAIGGIAIATVVFDLLYWSFGFLRVGTSGLAAQAFGRREDTTPILTRAVRIALYAAAGILLLQYPVYLLMPYCFSCSETVADFAQTYFLIRVWAAPATLSLMAFKGWFIGNQDTVSPMATDIVVNVTNILMSWLFAVVLKMGAAGVAYGTLVAQYTGLVLSLGIFRYRYTACYESLIHRTSSLQGPDLSGFSRLNANLFVRSVCFILIYCAYTLIASNCGTIPLAVSALYMHLFMFFSYFVDGYAYAGEALVGKAIGEKGKGSEIVSALFAHAIGVAVVFTVIFVAFGAELMRIFTDDVTVLDASEEYLMWLYVFPILSTLAFMWDGVYTGATRGTDIRNAMLWAAASFGVVYLLCIFIPCPFWGKVGIGVSSLHPLFAAYMAHLIARSGYLTYKY